MSFDRRRAGQNSDAGCPSQVSRVGPAQPRLGRMSASPPRATKHSHRSETPLCANCDRMHCSKTASLFDHLVGPAGIDVDNSTPNHLNIHVSEAITTLILGFPPSSVSSCTITRITTLGFFARAFAHSRSIISAFSNSVSRRCMNILRYKWPRGRRTAEKGDELAAVHSITSSASASSLSGICRPSAFAVFRLRTNSYFVGACTGSSPGFSPLRMRSTYDAACRYSSTISGP
jgi:hypothetical protein